MENKRLYVLVIAAIVGLVLILPASAAISFQKYTPTGTIFKPVATPTPVIPVKNISVINQPESVTWIQIPIDPQISSKFFNTSIPIYKSLISNPIATPALLVDKNKIIVTVWNQDHTQTVPGTTITFFQYIFHKQSGEGERQGFSGKVIATGVTDSNGRLTVVLPDTGGNKVEIDAKTPVFSENGEMVCYYGTQYLSYQTRFQEVILNTRVIVQ
ncbi:MAG: hypothetical protein MUF37_04940 [Methanoregulaceae archaeon]|jgi:hypothetical protein|nr:hypothetical protein [Methanoregulaceae archaeon]